MDVMHKYHHIDGDIPLKHMTMVPEYKGIVEKLFIEDDWGPFYSEIARLTAEAAKDHDRVVVSHNTTKNEHRDHVINKLIESGASKENITLILLTIDRRVKLSGMYHRTKRMAEQSGVTMTEFCKGVMDFEGEMTEEKYIDIRLEEEMKEIELYGFDDYHPEAIMVDSTVRDATRFDNIDKALGLTRPKDLTYEEICDQVKPLDEARDENVMGSGFLEAYNDVMARAEEVMKKLGQEK